MCSRFCFFLENKWWRKCSEMNSISINFSVNEILVFYYFFFFALLIKFFIAMTMIDIKKRQGYCMVVWWNTLDLPSTISLINIESAYYTFYVKLMLKPWKALLQRFHKFVWMRWHNNKAIHTLKYFLANEVRESQRTIN
jgi:hypothetical protein